jgi:protein AATF/BFR2
MRIAFQKAVPSAFSLPPFDEVDDDPEGEIEPKRADALSSLAELSETLFSLRSLISLPGTEAPAKRRRTGEPSDESYWTASAADSFALADAAHPALVPILNKWSTKIQAASLATNKTGGSKFAAAKPMGVVDAIDAALSQKRDAPKPLLEAEEGAYRGLLREVIESRGGGDVMAHRREKKKKREAERGGSKGRKLRYTVHDKAVNFVVPIPLEGGWHEEQVDELFCSLFGGVGLKGAVSDAPETNGVTDLGGLRVF